MFRFAPRLVNKSFVARQFAAAPRFYATDNSFGGSTTDSRKNIAVVFSGCGFLDGTEITEATSLLINLAQRPNWKLTYFAPDANIEEVWDHSTRTLDKNEVRKVQVETSRITRDKVLNLEALNLEANYDAVLFPGGYGAGTVLSNYSRTNRGDEPITVESNIKRIIETFHQAGKPMGFMCLSSILPALVLGTKNGGPGVTLTAGDEHTVAQDISSWGNTVRTVSVDSVVVDEDNKILSTPAYLSNNANAYDIYQGAENLVSELSDVFSGGKKTAAEGSTDFGEELEEVLEESLGKEEWARQKKQIFRTGGEEKKEE